VKPDQVVAVLLFTLAGSAHGSDWQRVAEFRDQGATFLLDAESVVAVGQNRKAWVEVDFTTEQSVPGSPLKKYLSERWLHYFDCAQKTSTQIQYVYYDNAMRVVASHAWTFEAGKMTDVVPGSAIEAMLLHTCRIKLARRPKQS
jgi:hypothetical protein